MAVVPVTSTEAVVFTEDRLYVTNLDLDGTIIEVAKAMLPASSERLEHLVRDAVEIGAKVISHGQSQSLIDSIASEIERLITATSTTTDHLPEAIQERVGELLSQLAQVLTERFDVKRVDSVPNQIRDLVASANVEQIREFTRDLVNEGGPLQTMNDKLVVQVKALNDTAQDVLTKVTSVAEKLEARIAVEQIHEKSTQKGAPFEEIVRAELEAIAGPLGDAVKCVSHDYGTASTQVGDLVVEVNPAHTRARSVSFVVEAKTGRLSGPKARAALEEAMENREAPAGILVFDDLEDAPLRGRRFACHPGGKFVVVFEPGEGDTLALEVAYYQARALAVESVDGANEVDAKWLIEQCDHVAKLIEDAREIKNGANAARRGLDRVDASYEQLRAEALAVLDDIKSKLN